VTAIPGPDADLYVTGSDGEVYRRRPGAGELWTRMETDDFDLAPGWRLRVAGRQIVARSLQGTLWLREDVVLGGGWEELESPGFAVTSFAVSGGDDVLRIAVRGPAGQVSIGERRSGSPVLWRGTRADDGWRPALDTDLAWAEPDPGTFWLFATGVDGTVRGLTGGEGMWRPVDPGGRQMGRPSRLAATCRTAGQIELFTETPERGLAWTWWS
jgi:hypothetical protein